MGRYLTGASASAMGAAAGAFVLPGQLPTFGTGRFLVFTRSQSWTPPVGVLEVRARVLGGGAGLTAGGSSSFGSYCSATGGQPASGAVAGVGGVGAGGDFQAAGGLGGAGFRGGGGASGSELGTGGAGGGGGATSGGGGGAVGGKVGGAGLNNGPRFGGGGASVFGNGSSPPDSEGMPGIPGSDLTGDRISLNNNGLVTLPHPLFGFVGGGGKAQTVTGQSGGCGAGGAGGGTSAATPGGRGGWGGACGGGGGAGGDDAQGGVGGFCWSAWDKSAPSTVGGQELRIGGGMGGTQARAGGGGGGYARGVFTVEPGQPIAITVAQQGDNYTQGVSGGLVIVEF